MTALSLSLSSCASVHIKDGEWCTDLGPAGATCFHTLTPATRDILPPQWDAERVGDICTSATNFANWKTALEQLCHDDQICDYQTQKQFWQFFQSVRNVQLKMGMKKPDLINKEAAPVEPPPEPANF